MFQESMEHYEERCIFHFKYDCDISKCIQNKGTERIESIIKASEAYNDCLHLTLHKDLEKDPNIKISYHKNCVSRYTSVSNIRKYRYQANEFEEQPTKRLKHSLFNFRSHCLYCGEDYVLEKEPKNPQRWTPAYLCHSTMLEHNKKTYKDYLLETGKERDDEMG